MAKKAKDENGNPKIPPGTRTEKTPPAPDAGAGPGTTPEAPKGRPIGKEDFPQGKGGGLSAPTKAAMRVKDVAKARDGVTLKLLKSEGVSIKGADGATIMFRKDGVNEVKVIAKKEDAIKLLKTGRFAVIE